MDTIDVDVPHRASSAQMREALMAVRVELHLRGDGHISKATEEKVADALEAADEEEDRQRRLRRIRYDGVSDDPQTVARAFLDLDDMYRELEKRLSVEP